MAVMVARTWVGWAAHAERVEAVGVRCWLGRWSPCGVQVGKAGAVSASRAWH